MSANISNNSTAKPAFVDENAPWSDLSIAICEAAVVSILCAMSWIIICMVVYGKKMNQWENTEAGRMYIAAFAIMSVYSLGLIVHLVLLEIPNIPGGIAHCEQIADLSYAFKTTALFSTYFFLWARQRAFNSIPAFKRIWVTMISWLLFVVIALVYVLILTTATIPQTTLPTVTGCKYMPEKNMTEIEVLRWWLVNQSHILITAMIFIQISLLFLFTYPLLQNRFGEHKPGSKNGQPDKILGVVRRSLVCALIANFTDILASVVHKILADGENSFPVMQTVLVIDIFVNDICILGTFKEFKKILTVFCAYKYFNRDSSGTAPPQTIETVDI